MRSATLILSLLVLAGCGSPAANPAPIPAGATSVRLPVEPVGVLARLPGAEVRQGGYGSSMAPAPGRPGVIYLLTDRGPNVDLPDDHKKFPLPEYAPRLGEFRVLPDRVELVRTIVLADSTGRPMSGLPNPTGPGGTGETPLALDGTMLPTATNGLDPEGLVALADGSFWVSDEYGPWLVHFGPDGRMLARRSPFASFGGGLPAVLAARRANRGMEGLAPVPGSGMLAGLMQSPLDNPKAAGRKSRAVRLLLLDPASGATRQYVYLLDTPGYRTTEIAAVSATRFLVLEIDGKPRMGDDVASFMRVFLIDLAGATDVSDPADGPRGRLYGGRTLEELDPAEYSAAGIVPVGKTLVLDLLDPAVGYPHEKPEGLALVDPQTVAIANDDDFGVDAGPDGAIVPKRMADGSEARNEVWYVRLERVVE